MNEASIYADCYQHLHRSFYLSVDNRLTDTLHRLLIRFLECRDYQSASNSGLLFGSLAVGSSVVKLKPRAQCPTDQNLIVGGTAARFGEFPHMARLAMPDENGAMVFRCGATLISEQWVMTAAHCLESQTIVVRLGELKEGNDEFGDPVDVQVTRIVKHPNYKPRTVYNDIALLKLARPVTFSTRIRPACLYGSSTVDRTKAVAIGFGSTEACKYHSWPKQNWSSLASLTTWCNRNGTHTHTHTPHIFV